MRKALIAVLVSFLFALPCAAPVAAQEHRTLGYGRFFTNDALGDGRDRWRTGSYAVSMLRGAGWNGAGWNGALPARVGEVLEFRLRSEVIAPQNLKTPAAMGRRYVGALTAGVHTHFGWRRAEMRLGVDLVATGPQTGVGRLQTELHKLFGMATPGTLAGQIPNHVYPTVSAEIGRSFTVGGAQVRPFAEAQAGVETYVRIGGDVVLGRFGENSLMLRDQVTGQRYTGIRGEGGAGVSFIVGGDLARVFESAYVPEGGAVTSSKTRSRLRAGVNWRGKKSEIFYGVTHLGREFETQTSGQTLGSLRLHVRF